MKLGSIALAALATTALTSALFVSTGHAQTFPIYGDYSFPGGSGPRGALVQARNGTFYGTTTCPPTSSAAATASSTA